MSEPTITARVVVPEAVVSRELDGEMVLLNLDTGIYFGLDAVGTDMWRALQSGCTLGEATDALHLQYDVDAAILREDLLRLVDQLQAKGLLQIAS